MDFKGQEDYHLDLLQKSKKEIIVAWSGMLRVIVVRSRNFWINYEAQVEYKS